MTTNFVLHKGDPERSRIMANCAAMLPELDPVRSWIISIKRYTKQRSNDQNAALWGLAYPILSKATGEDVNDWHEYMLGEYFGWVEFNLFGKRKLRPARTTTTGFRGEDSVLSTIEFAEFFDFIQRRAAQNGIHIPDPDPFHAERAA